MAISNDIRPGDYVKFGNGVSGEVDQVFFNDDGLICSLTLQDDISGKWFAIEIVDDDFEGDTLVDIAVVIH